jgi:hypothetical protein
VWVIENAVEDTEQTDAASPLRNPMNCYPAPLMKTPIE